MEEEVQAMVEQEDALSQEEATTKAPKEPKGPKVYKSEASKRIAEAQMGVTKQQVVLSDDQGNTFPSLCAALIHHNLDKHKDWAPARNALRRRNTYTRLAPFPEGHEHEGKEYEVTFTVISQQEGPLKPKPEAASEAASETTEAAE